MSHSNDVDLARRRGPGTAPAEIPERFLARVAPAGACWMWTGSLNEGGYGLFSNRGRTVLAHRFAYQAKRGPVPAGLELDHTCREPRCVNPAHLEAVTHAENVARAMRARRLCRNRLHAMPENRMSNKGGPRCRLCHIAAVERWNASNREKCRGYKRRWEQINRPLGTKRQRKNAHSPSTIDTSGAGPKEL